MFDLLEQLCNPYNYYFNVFLTDGIFNWNSEGIELSDRDIELLEDTLAVGLVLLGVGVALKYNVNHDWGKSFGDSITSLALNMAWF